MLSPYCAMLSLSLSLSIRQEQYKIHRQRQGTNPSINPQGTNVPPSLSSTDILPVIAERETLSLPVRPFLSSPPSSMTDLTNLTNSSTTAMSTTAAAAAQPPAEDKKTPQKDTVVQQWYKSANDILVGPVRRKRMPAGRHAVVVSPPAKAEAQLQQAEAGKQ